MSGEGEATRGRGSVLDPGLIRLARVIVLGSIMSFLDTTMVNVALDRLGHDFKSSVSEIQWVSTGYLLALALVLPLTGWFVERFGAKRSWLGALGVFLVGSIACGFAWSIPSLVVFRFLQGFGGGMIIPIGQSILASHAGPGRMGRIMSVIGVINTLAPIMGPVIGGLILADFSWRWIFFVNIPIGAIAIGLGTKVLPRGEAHVARRIDFVGLALMSPGLALLVYGLSETGSGGSLTRPAVAVPIVAGVVLIVGFLAWSRVTSEPLLNLGLLRERQFTTATAAVFFLNGGVFGLMFLLPLYYQVVRGQSAFDAGLLMAPQGIGSMIAMPIAGRAIDRSKQRPLGLIGGVIAIAGTIAYGFVGSVSNELVLSFSLFVRGFGLGLVVIVFVAGAYGKIPRDQVAQGTTLFSIISRVGATAWTAVLAVILQKRIGAFDPTAGASVLAHKVGGAASVAVSRAFGQTFIASTALLALMLVPTFILERRILRAPPAPPTIKTIEPDFDVALLES